MKAAPLIFFCAALLLTGCATDKPVTLADLHPTAPGTAIYNPTNNTTMISNNGSTWCLLGNCTNVMLYTEDTPEPVPARIFERLYQMRNPQTAVAVEYLGQKDGYAYLRTISIPLQKPKERHERINYVKLADLDPAFRDALPPNPPPKK